MLLCRNTNSVIIRNGLLGFNLEDVHLAQAKNYVIAYDKPVGLLTNFGVKSLQFKKTYNTKYFESSSKSNNQENQD